MITSILGLVLCFTASATLPYEAAAPKAEGDCLSELTHEGAGLDIDPELEVDDLFGFSTWEGRCCTDFSYTWVITDAPNVRYRLRVQSDCAVEANVEAAVGVPVGGILFLEWTPPADNCDCTYHITLERHTPTQQNQWSYVPGSSVEVSCETDCN